MYLNNIYTLNVIHFEKTCTKYNHIFGKLNTNQYLYNMQVENKLYFSKHNSVEKLQLTITAIYTIIEWVKFKNLLFKKKTNHSKTMIIYYVYVQFLLFFFIEKLYFKIIY